MRIAIATITVFWVTQFITLSTLRHLRFPEEGFDYFLPRVIVTAAGFILSLAMLVAQTRARGASLLTRALFAVALAMIGCSLHALINYFVFLSSSPGFDLSMYALLLLDRFWFYLSLSVMILVLIHSADILDSRVEIESLKTQTTRAQLSALRYQLNPHFLFNTLNSIAALVVERQPEQAERMINRLSDFLRAGLEADPIEEVPLHAELAQQRRYLDIEQIRFPNRLAFSFDVAAEVHDALVPSLILQPLVENAIKFAVAPSPGLVSVSIVAAKVGDQLRIDVCDDGRALAKGSGGAGIGLENVRKRLASSFGDDASFASGAREGGGYQVTIIMPLRHQA